MQAQNASSKRYYQAQALMGATRPASGIKAKAQTPNKGSQIALITHLLVAFAFMPDARRVAPIRGCVLWQRYLYYTTNTLLAEYLTSYTNSLQLIDCQCFTQCKMLQIPPTRNLHNSRCCHTDKHGRKMSRHRGAERSVAPTNCSASLCRIIYCIRPNRLRDRG